MYVAWTDADGRKARRYQKPKSWTMRDICAAESALLRWRLARHHVKNGDGAYELECIKSKDDAESAGAHEDEATDADRDNEACASSCSVG